MRDNSTSMVIHTTLDVLGNPFPHQFVQSWPPELPYQFPLRETAFGRQGR